MKRIRPPTDFLSARIVASKASTSQDSGRIGKANASRRRIFRSVTSGVVAMSAGENPREVLSRIVRVVGTDCRPSDKELSQISAEAA